MIRLGIKFEFDDAERGIGNLPLRGISNEQRQQGKDMKLGNQIILAPTHTWQLHFRLGNFNFDSQ